MPAAIGPSGSRDPLRVLYEREQRRRRPRSRILAMTLAVCILGGFGVVVYYAYHEGVRAGSESVAPLIKAEQQPYKVKPDEPGGMEVPDQDKLIYDEVSPKSGGEGAQKAEHLLPPPENPLPRPAAEPPSDQTQGSSAPSPAASVAGSSQAGSGSVASNAGQPPTPAEAPAANQTPPQQARATPAEAATAPAASGPVGKATAATNAAGSKASKTGPASGTQLAARPSRWRVQLGSVRSAESARQQWSHLQSEHPDLLSALTLDVRRADLGPGKGVFYRIQVGPLSDKQAANALCDRLKAVRVGCLAVEP